MAMNDISLTSGMRSNLVQLQSTVSLLDRTQERLASGKKVNSALDNPINFFAAQGHLSRAADIASYKDIMSEGIQTIQTASAGIKGIQGLIEGARALAQSALAANANQFSFTVSTAATSGNTVVISGSTYTAVNTGAGASQFNVQDADGNALSLEEIASNLAGIINATKETGQYGNIKANYNGNRITLTTTASDKAITGTGVITDTNSRLTLDTTITSERETLASQYEGLLGQIDSIAGASGYKGNNLLANDTLSVTFEGGSVSVKGFNAYVSDMGVNTTGFAKATLAPTTGPKTKWALTSDIRFDLVNLDKGLDKLESESKKLSSAVSVINVQQDYSTSKINLLTEGSDNLTSADANEEGANMLMLQTRQALSTTALSLSAQASQSVLRLFG